MRALQLSVLAMLVACSGDRRDGAPIEVVRLFDMEVFDLPEYARRREAEARVHVHNALLELLRARAAVIRVSVQPGPWRDDLDHKIHLLLEIRCGTVVEGPGPAVDLGRTPIDQIFPKDVDIVNRENVIVGCRGLVVDNQPHHGAAFRYPDAAP